MLMMERKESGRFNSKRIHSKMNKSYIKRFAAFCPIYFGGMLFCSFINIKIKNISYFK